MSAGIRHTKTQANHYHSEIKKTVLVPLQMQLIERLANAAETASAWQQAVSDSFAEWQYNGVVDTTSPELARKQIMMLARWHKDKMQTQFEQLFSLDVQPLLRERVTSDVLTPIINTNIDLIRSIPRELHDKIKQDFTNIIYTDGFDQEKIGKMLTQRFSVGNSRAKLIAYDQCNKTIGALSQTRQKQVGVKMFMWRTSEDERVRPEHRALDGKIFMWDVPPSVGIPGQPINCRCVSIPIIPGVDDLISKLNAGDKK